MKFVLLVLLAAGALSAPFNSKWETEDILSVDDFRPEGHKFSFFEQENSCGGKLHSGRVYEYSYVGETENKIQGSSPDSTGLQMQAQITIRSGSDCVFALQVKEAKLLMKSKSQRTFVPAVESDKFSNELTAYELKFKITKGNIVSIYPETNEAIHVLNIKRGILSALQLSDSKEEVDVNGRCNVKTETVDGLTIKTKDLSECTQRVHNELGFQSTSIEGESTIINPLNSTSACKYTFQDNREILAVQCTEIHTFRPFSSGYKTSAGVVNIVTQTLKSMNVYNKPAVPMRVGEPSSIIFDNGKEDLKPVNTIVNEVDQIMHRLVDQSQELGMLAKRDSAHEFSRLVTLLRRLDRKRMVPIWSKYIDCTKSKVCEANQDLVDVYRQYLLDALTYCGTTTCVTMVHNVIVDNTVSGEHMNMFLQGISLVKSPTKGMIRDLTNIVRVRPSRQAYLSLGTLIFRYCKMMPEECRYDSTNPVTQAETLMMNKLGQSCEGQDNSDRVEELLMTLKSVGNAGRPLHLSSTLLSCAMTSLHQNVSLAAFDALRRMPCKESVINELLNMLENVDLDPERRIAAYVSVMKCPTESSIKRVTLMLQKEESNQVGSFVYTHLKNVNESSNPIHASTQALLNKVLGSKQLTVVDLPKTMYSHAYEGSFFNKFTKCGASLEGHLVYHPNSYLPRTALLNMTAEVMGISLNVIELAARMEGFETIIEDAFGPDGYYPNSHIMDIFNKTFMNKEKIEMLKSRSRRSATATMEENISELHKRANAKRPIPSGHVSMKMFGHEMRLFSYDDIFYKIDEIDNMNVIELLLKLAKGGHKTFTKSIMFLEVTHTVPTGLGLPLEVKLVGSAVGSVRVDGKFDIRNMFWGPGSMEMKGALHPSAVVEVSGEMGIHSHYIKSGAFVNASMFTSSVLQGSITYKAGQLLKVNIDTPQNPMEVFNVSVTPFMYINEDSSLVGGVPRRMNPSFCVNSTRVLGLGVCTSFAVPLAYREYEAPYFPLSGPAHFGMKVIRADPKLTTYQWLVSMKDEPEKGKVGQFVFSTPGATYERKFVGELRYLATKTYRTMGFANLQGDKKTELTFSYNNNTNAMEATFESNMWTPKMFRSKVALTNDTFYKTRQLGVKFVTEYDWYKFQHVAMVVNKTNSYMLHSKTTYFPGKHLTGEIEFYPSDKNVAIRLDANQLNQRVEFHGKVVHTSTAMGMNFTAHHLSLDKSATFFVGYTNTTSSKRLVFNGTVLGKSAESSLGYFVTAVGREIRMELGSMGKRAGLFANCSSDSSLKAMDFGMFYKAYRIGSKITAETVDKKRNICYSVFYGSKQPASICLNTTVGQGIKEPSMALLSYRILNYVAAVSADYRLVDGKYTFNTSALYNKKVVASNLWQLDYKNWWDAELMMNTTVASKRMGLRWFVNKPVEHITTVGVEASIANRTVKLTSSYHREVSTENNAVIYGVIFEAAVNQKKLPGNFTLLFENGKDLKGVSVIGKLFSYEVKKNLAWMQPKATEHSLSCEMSLKKAGFVILSKKDSGLLVLGATEKAIKYTHTLMVWEKAFEYGWDAVYRNSTTVSKSAHAVTAGFTYTKGRRVSTTLTFANGVKATELLVDVEYLPRKQVTHVVRYDKELKTLKVAVEFLPKMFVTLRGAVRKSEGFSILTDLEFNWKNFNRIFHFDAGFVNRTDVYKLFSRFTAYGKNLVALTEFNKKTKSGSASVNMNGKSLKLEYGMTSSPAKYQIALVYGEKKIVEAVLEHGNGRCTFQVRTPSRVLMKSIAKDDRIHGIFSHELLVADKSVMLHEVHHKTIEGTLAYHFSSLGVKRFELVGKLNKEAKSVFIHGSLLKKNYDLGIAGKWDDAKQAVTVSFEAVGKVFGFIARLQPSKLVSSFHVFYDNRIVSGFHLFGDKQLKALVYNVTLTPTYTYQVVAEVVDDHILKTTLQRKAANKVINETTFTYKLSPAESRFMIQWNKETVKAIEDLVYGRVLPGFKNITTWTRNMTLWTRNATINASYAGKDLAFALLKNFTRNLLNKTNRLDQMFDDFDFVGARDTIGATVLAGLKKSSHVGYSAMMASTKYLELINQYTPIVMKNTRSFIKATMLRYNNVNDVFWIVFKNVTESGRPVVETAIKLAKEFKLRNKSMEVIVTDLAKAANESAIKLASIINVQGRKYINIALTKIYDTKVPYTDKKIGEIIVISLDKIKARTDNFNMTSMLKNATVFVLEYKLNGTSVRDHVFKLMDNVQALPENLKQYSKYAIKTWRENYVVYQDNINDKLMMMKVFATPLMDHLKQVNASLHKRFGPLYVKAVNFVHRAIIQDYQDAYYKLVAMSKEYTTMKINAINAFVMPLATPFSPFATEMLQQISSLEVLESKLGAIVEKMSGMVANVSVKSLDAVKTKLSTELKKIKENIETLHLLTAEELVAKLVDYAVLSIKKSSTAMLGMYNDLDQVKASILTQVKELKFKLNNMVSTVSQRTPTEWVEIAFSKSGEKLRSTALELSKITTQLANLNLADPAWQLWKEIDVIAHLDRYGVNDQLTDLITKAKKENVTEIILRVAKYTSNGTLIAMNKTLQRVKDIVATVKYVHSVIKAIPKKSFDDFYGDLTTALIYGKNVAVREIFSTYDVSSKVLRKFLDEKNAYYLNTYEKYVLPAQDWYYLVKDRSILVYNDNKDDTVRVYNFYKDIVVDFYNVKAGYLKDQVMERVNIVKSRADVIKSSLETFLAKHEDKTWEEVADLVSAYASEKAATACSYTKARSFVVKAFVNKTVALANEAYRNATLTAKKYIAFFNATVRPMIMQRYTIARTYLNEAYRNCTERCTKAYNDLQMKALQWYAENKAKTVFQLYKEGKDISVVYATKQWERMNSTSRAMYAQLSTNIRDRMAVIIPELKREGESIINQTLTVTVILANETVKAYYPHYTIVRAHVVNASRIVVDGTRQLVQKSAVILKQRVEALKNNYTVLLKNLQEHPTFVKIVSGSVVKNATVQYYKAVAEIQKKVVMLKEYLEILKSHPTVLKVKAMIVEYQKQLLAYIEMLKEYQQHPTVVTVKEHMRLLNESVAFTWSRLYPDVVKSLETVKMTGGFFHALMVNYATEHASMFRRQPAECFWTNVANTKVLSQYVKTQIDFLKQERPERHAERFMQWLDTNTDDYAKSVVTKAKEVVLLGKEKVLSTPIYAKQQWQSLALWVQSKYGNTSESFKGCPLHAIMTNQIWKEFGDEAYDLAKVDEIKQLIAVQYAAMKIHYNTLRSRYFVMKQQLQDKIAEHKLKIQGKFDSMKAKALKFVNEVTLEDIVLGSMEKSAALYNKATAMKADTLNKLVQYKAKLNNTIRQYVAIVRVYIADVKIATKQQLDMLVKKIDQYYPVSSINFRDHYVRAIAKINELKVKIIMLAKELKQNVTRFSIDLKKNATLMLQEKWLSSCVRSKMMLFKKMTIRQTIDATKKLAIELPLKASRIVKELKANVTAKVLHFNQVYVVPVSTIAKDVILAVANEVNETAVFCYRYYGMKENAIKFVNYTRDQVALVLPKVSAYIKSSFLNATNTTLKYFHKSLVNVDNFDYRQHMPDCEKYGKAVKAYVDKIHQYVSVDYKSATVMLTLPHPRQIKPTFSENIQVINTTARDILDKINNTALIIVNKTKENANKMYSIVMNATVELRSDVTALFTVNRDVATHFYALGMKYGRVAMNSTANMTSYWFNVTRKATIKAAEEFKNKFALAKESAKIVFHDIYSNSASWEEVYEKTKEYVSFINVMSRIRLDAYYNNLKIRSEEIYAMQKENYENLLKVLKPYFELLKLSAKRMRAGEKFSEAFREIIQMLEKYKRQVETSVSTSYDNAVEKFTSNYPDTAQLMQEYNSVHQAMFTKYGRKAADFYTISKVGAERMWRKFGRNCNSLPKKAMKLIPSRESSAMIFGYNHVMTFDKKFYEFPNYVNKKCTYLLASDFQQQNFTIVSQSDAIIIMTPDMKVTIHQSGQVETVVKVAKMGFVRQEVFKGLPVQSSSGSCSKVMKASIISCHFDQGVTVRCDPKHFLCTIKLSGWNYGKSKGILGTNNNERYDEFTTPDGVITTSVNKLAASWEISGDPACANPNINNIPLACNQAPSQRCYDLFQKNSSRFSRYFNAVDPRPFLKACAVDSSDCAHNKPYDKSHCNATAAYVAMLRMSGVRGAKMAKDCMSYTTSDQVEHHVMEQWVQTGSKDADITVLVSERDYLQGLSKVYAQLLYATHKSLMLKGFNTRYSLIGYGGKGVHEPAHVHTLDGQNFNSIFALVDTLKAMPYTGSGNDSNDALQAIVTGTTLSYRPGAARIFIMFNSGRDTPSLVSMDEAEYALRYEANATLFVFDNFQFKDVVKGKVMGHTMKRIFPAPYYKPLPLSGLEFPTADLADLAQITNGGVFSSKIKSSDVKSLSTALADALYPRIAASARTCKRCTLNPSYAGFATPICTDDRFLFC